MVNKPTCEELEQKIRNFEEDALQHQEAKKELLYRSEFERLVTMTSTSFINLSPDEIDDEINDTLQRIGEFADADRSYVFLFDEVGEHVDNTHEWCSETIEAQIQNLKGVSVEEFKWSIGQIKAGEIVYVPCTADLPPEAAAEKVEFESEQIQSLINVPMSSKGIVVGFLGFDFVKKANTLEEGIITLLKIVGEIVASALERKRIEEAFYKSEEKFRALVEGTSDWVWEIDLNGVYTYTNPNVKTILGCEPEEIIGMKAFDTLKADDAKRAGEKFKRMVELKRPLVMGEYVHTHKDGFRVIVETSAEPFFDTNGNLLGFRGIDRDITARKRMEEELRKARDELQIRVEERTSELASTNEALRESEERYRKVVELSPETIIVQIEGKIAFINTIGAKLFGASGREELIGRSFLDFVHPEHQEIIRTRKKEAKLEGVKSNLVEVGFIRLDGQVIDSEVVESQVNFEGNPAMLTFIRDITERKRTQKVAEENAFLYRTLTTSIADGVILVQDGKIFFANDAFARMCGYGEPDEIAGMDVSRFFDSKITQFFRAVSEPGEHDREVKGSLQGMYFTRTDKKLWMSMNNSVISWKSKPAILTAIRDVTEKVLQERAVREEAESLRRENIKLRSSIKERYKFGKIIGKSLAMQDVYELILKAAATNSDVIILGESGTGKELVARSIHNMSDRAHRSFITVNCGAIPEYLIESEFFGHVKGAFTGAHRGKEGYLHAANGGALFLDEVGEIGLNIQVKLLRAFENGEYSLIGDTKSKKSDFRIISATNKDLSNLTANGLMRQDFYYRISVIPIVLPPLRERKDDIPLLVDHFLQLFAKGETVPTIPGKDMDILLHHNWPGNIRELQNVLKRFLAIRNFDFMESLPETLPAVQDICSEKVQNKNLFSFRDTLQDVEKKTIVNALNEVSWNRTKAASMLGISRRTLFRRIEKLGLNGPVGPN